MGMHDELSWLVQMGVLLLPYVLVWMVGLILALVYWRRYPQPALLLFLACVLELFSTVGGEFLNLFLFHDAFFDDGLLSFSRLVYIFRSVLGAAAWGLVIAAVLGWRNQQFPIRRDSRGYVPLAARRPVAPPELPFDDDAETIREKP